MESIFNLKNYLRLINTFQRFKYEFFTFSQYLELANQISFSRPSENILLLRHDVDADLHAAERMAVLEAEAGIRATYFVMTRSPIYNLFSRKCTKTVQLISSLGHEIGLHYDANFSPNGDQAHLNWIDRECEMIESITSKSVRAVSFHQPSQDFLRTPIELCKGRINTYDKSVLNDMRYISDSNRKFSLVEGKCGPINDILSESIADLNGEKIQLLIHPMWWYYSVESTQEVWNLAIADCLNEMQKQLLSTERAYGHPRRFIIE